MPFKDSILLYTCQLNLRCADPGTTACASDSKKFGAWDQNLMTEWHIRYGGRGVMIYWHVEKNSVCIYSQMIQQVLSQPQWMKLMKEEDLRALSPLIWGHVNPYGTFRLDLNERLPIDVAA